MKTLIIGLGNPILGDDGVGWKIAQEVEKQLLPPSSPPNFAKFSEIGGMKGGISVECLSLAGIALMEHMIGYQRVILIDSLNTGKYAQGEIVTFTLDSLVDLTYGHSASAHDASLKTALKMGRGMGAELPVDENITIVAIEAAHVYDFTEELTPEVAKSVPKAVEIIMKLVDTVI